MVDGIIYHIADVPFRVELQVFANAVVDHHRVVHGETHDGEQGHDEEAVDFHRQYEAQHRKHAHGNQDIVGQGNDGEYGVVQLKPQAEVGDDARKGHQQRQQPGGQKLLPNHRPHGINLGGVDVEGADGLFQVALQGGSLVHIQVAGADGEGLAILAQQLQAAGF